MTLQVNALAGPTAEDPRYINAKEDWDKYMGDILDENVVDLRRIQSYLASTSKSGSTYQHPMFPALRSSPASTMTDIGGAISSASAMSSNTSTTVAAGSGSGSASPLITLTDAPSSYGVQGPSGTQQSLSSTVYRIGGLGTTSNTLLGSSAGGGVSSALLAPPPTTSATGSSSSTTVTTPDPTLGNLNSISSSPFNGFGSVASTGAPGLAATMGGIFDPSAHMLAMTRTYADQEKKE